MKWDGTIHIEWIGWNNMEWAGIKCNGVQWDGMMERDRMMKWKKLKLRGMKLYKN